jgi:hypothetical protein
MPPELWQDSELDKMQRYSRYRQASRRIEDLNRALIALVDSHSDWAMRVSDESERLIINMLRECEHISHNHPEGGIV